QDDKWADSNSRIIVIFQKATIPILPYRFMSFYCYEKRISAFYLLAFFVMNPNKVAERESLGKNPRL
ncbi:MAG: hypothetical protein JW702_07075, partial [Clostridiales bacterium]|nr:hypothetical protein [Clostridiales bacterium]